MSDEVLFFGDIQNEYRCFSLEYPCVIEYDNKEFNSVLHLYLYLKFLKNEKIRDKLLQVNRVTDLLEYKEILALDKINNPNDDLSDDMVMVSLAVHYRMRQSELFKRLLMETKQQNLLYVVASSILDPQLWTYRIMSNLEIETDNEEKVFLESDGQNLYGNILKMTRFGIIKNLRKINN